MAARDKAETKIKIIAVKLHCVSITIALGIMRKRYENVAQ